MLLPVRGERDQENPYHCSHHYLEVSITVIPKPCYQYNYVVTSSLATVGIQKKYATDQDWLFTWVLIIVSALVSVADINAQEEE